MTRSSRFRVLLRASRLYLDTPSRAAEAYRVMDQLDLDPEDLKRWERTVRKAARDRYQRRMRRSYS